MNTIAERTITVFNTESNSATTLVTDATTYGQIKHNFTEGMKVMVRETKVTLEHDDALLPEGDFTIFLFPTKVKSGWEDEQEEEEEYEGEDYESDVEEDEEEVKVPVTNTLEDLINSKFAEFSRKQDTIIRLLTVDPAQREQEMEAVRREEALRQEKERQEAAVRAEKAALEARLAEEARNFRF